MRTRPPYVAEPVHFVLDGRCCAALVTETGESPADVGLVAFPPRGGTALVAYGGVAYDPGRGHALDGDRTCRHEHLAGTWHRPTPGA